MKGNTIRSTLGTTFGTVCATVRGKDPNLYRISTETVVRVILRAFSAEVTEEVRCSSGLLLSTTEMLD